MIDWDDLLRREGSAVWNTVYRVVGNEADADECFQETFLAALEFSNRESVHNWPALLQRLAAGRAIDRLRKRIRQRKSKRLAEIVQHQAPRSDPAQPVEMAELDNALDCALAQLPRRSAQIFCLHEFDGWSHEQIAGQFGMSANAVRAILHRARHKLQRLLKDKFQISESPAAQQP